MLTRTRNDEVVVAGNTFDKYGSKHVVHRRLVAGFLRCAADLLCSAHPESVLEVGAGPGDLAYRLFAADGETSFPMVPYCGTDISADQVRMAQARYPGFHFQCASVYDLPFGEGDFDLCLACEVLEHLAQPLTAIAEISRVTRRWLLVSVPWEPQWRLMNMLRGKYLHHWGNTPGHVQHFTRRVIEELVSSHFEIVAERRPFPWTMILGRRLGSPRVRRVKPR